MDTASQFDCEVAHVIDSKYVTFMVGDTITSTGVLYVPLNCEGDIKVIDFYSTSELLSERYYSGRLSEKTISLADISTYEMKEKKVKYFKLLPSKEWIFYRRDGSVWTTATFE